MVAEDIKDSALQSRNQKSWIKFTSIMLTLSVLKLIRPKGIITKLQHKYKMLSIIYNLRKDDILALSQ